MGFRFVQKSMTLNSQNTQCSHLNQNVISYGRNVRLMLVFLAYLLLHYYCSPTMPTAFVLGESFWEDTDNCQPKK